MIDNNTTKMITNKNKSFAFFIRILNKDRDNGNPYTESENLSHIIESICEKHKIKLVDATSSSIGPIINSILQAIEEADAIFVDANQPNENVWFEFGYAHRVNPLKIIYLFRKGRSLPFDVSNLKGFEYESLEPKYTKELGKKIDESLGDLLLQSRVHRMILSNDWETELTKYIFKKTKAKKEIGDYLNNIAGDVKVSTGIRKRAIYCYLSIGYIDVDLFFRLINPHVEEEIRVSLLQGLQKIYTSINTDFWRMSLSTKVHAVLREAAAAATIQWLHGYISDNFFIDNVVNHKEWIVRKHVAIKICQNTEPKVLPIINILIKDNRDEVYKRFVDWIDTLSVTNTSINHTERSILYKIKEAWKESPELILRSKIEEIDLLINRHKEIE